MIRRLELAQALVNAPRLLVLDEPRVGLDPIARGDVWEYINRGRIRTTGRPADLHAGLGDGATLDGVFRRYTGDTLDNAPEEGGIRDVRRARRTARRLG